MCFAFHSNIKVMIFDSNIKVMIFAINTLFLPLSPTLIYEVYWALKTNLSLSPLSLPLSLLLPPPPFDIVFLVDVVLHEGLVIILNPYWPWTIAVMFRF